VQTRGEEMIGGIIDCNGQCYRYNDIIHGDLKVRSISRLCVAIFNEKIIPKIERHAA